MRNLVYSDGRGNGSSVCVVLSSPDDAPLSFLIGEVDEVYMATLEVKDEESIVCNPTVYQNSHGSIIIGLRETEEADEEYSFIMLGLKETKDLIRDLQAAFDSAVNELKE